MEIPRFPIILGLGANLPGRFGPPRAALGAGRSVEQVLLSASGAGRHDYLALASAAGCPVTQLPDALFASGDVERSQAAQSEESVRKLQALGYMEE